MLSLGDKTSFEGDQPALAFSRSANVRLWNWFRLLVIAATQIAWNALNGAQAFMNLKK